jgi:hypothetical protein
MAEVYAVGHDSSVTCAAREWHAINAMIPPQHPQPPQPQPPATPQPRAPMVYVYERQQWEYRVVVQSAMTQDELNALGAEGWELAGLVSVPNKTTFYFKRVRAEP